MRVLWNFKDSPRHCRHSQSRKFKSVVLLLLHPNILVFECSLPEPFLRNQKAFLKEQVWSGATGESGPAVQRCGGVSTDTCPSARFHPSAGSADTPSWFPTFNPQTEQTHTFSHLASHVKYYVTGSEPTLATQHRRRGLGGFSEICL